MTVTWLGQAGLLFEKSGARIMIDPYLSNSVEKVDPKNSRRMPVCEKLFEIAPDVMIFTHDHLDHYDPETASRFLARWEKSMTVLCPRSVWGKARLHGGGHNYVQFDRGCVFSVDECRFTAVKAAHSDPDAIGVLVEEQESGKIYYVTGDTLYHRDIFTELPDAIEAIFLPINGAGNNMNVTDAAAFCRRICPRAAVPIHWGMFDNIDPACFDFGHRVIPNIYERVELPQ